MANKSFCLFTFIKSTQVCLWMVCLCINSLTPVFLFLLLSLSQATTPSHSVRPCQLLWFCLLLRVCLLLSPSALESFRWYSFQWSNCFAFHLLLYSLFAVVWRAYSAFMSHSLLLCHISWLSLELHVLSEGLMRVCLFMSACCSGSGGGGEVEPQVEMVLDAFLSLLVQLWFSVCSMEKEEESPVVRSFVW